MNLHQFEPQVDDHLKRVLQDVQGEGSDLWREDLEDRLEEYPCVAIGDVWCNLLAMSRSSSNLVKNEEIEEMMFVSHVPSLDQTMHSSL